MKETYYFAYGSNINLNQMAVRCPDAKVVEPAVLENYELLFQLASYWGENEEIELMWGDAGVGNFFIHPEDLRRRDFSRVAYTMDCC